MKSKILLSFLFVVALSVQGFSQRYPFPQHTEYYTHIKPGQYSQDQLDDKVRSYYDAWKTKYLINGCESNQYYVFFDSGNTNTVSEAMGYGMLIVPLMAGYDAEAKTIFDGLYRYYKAHPSHIMPHLMVWKQITGCKDSDGPDSASDGDIDIAFGLLLAHAQWGSAGAINYFREAMLIINDLMGSNPSEGDINQDYFTVKLGDWVQSGHFMQGTRTSDFIMDHFRAFECAAKDTNWNQVVNKCYDLVADMQTNYSPETGLLPDFIDDVDEQAKPAEPNYLEGDLDGNYSYNACRDPWRMATDYLIFGDERAKAAVIKINRWLLESTGGSTNKVYAGYYLDGTKAVSWTDNSFTAPFAVGAMLDTANQKWLNKLYAKILLASTANGGYYDNTLRLLSMITISGNYWVPDCDILNGFFTKIARPADRCIAYYSKTSGMLVIKGKPAFQGQSLKVTVSDILGRSVVENTTITNSKSELSLQNCPAGIYFVTITTQDGKLPETHKVIKDE